MIKRSLLPLLVLIILGTSCSKNSVSLGVHIDTPINISVVDSQGADLLDPSTVNHFNSSDIKIFHLIDGEKIEFKADIRLDYPKGFLFYTPNQLGFNDNYVLCLQSPNHSKSEEFPITYLQWSESDTDTIKCQFSRTNVSLVCTKVWYNDVEVWGIKNNNNIDGRWFQIIKP